MKAPGFSTEREMPSTEGPVASMAEALNLRSPALVERVTKAAMEDQEEASNT